MQPICLHVLLCQTPRMHVCVHLQVVKCLSGTIVGPKGSIKDHLAKLSDKVLINPDKVKETLSSLSAKAGPAGKGAKDSKAAADGKAAESLDLKLASIITQRVKEQFGVPQVGVVLCTVPCVAFFVCRCQLCASRGRCGCCPLTVVGCASLSFCPSARVQPLP